MDVDDADQDSPSTSADKSAMEHEKSNGKVDEESDRAETSSVPPQSVVIGPKHAPSYRVVESVMEKEDGPGPRCGHTLTAVAAVWEEGAPGYIGPRLILFGGATTLEGNSAAPGTPSSAGSVGISM